MAKRTIEWESKGADKVVSDVKKVTDAESGLSKATKALEKQAKSTKVAIKDLSDDAQKKLKELQDATTKKMEGHAKAIRNVAGAVTIAVAAAAKFITAYAETEGVIDRLRRTLETSAEGVDNVNAALQRATDTFRDWHQFGVSTAEMAGALEELVRTTGDYDQSMQDVALALDVAAGSGWDFQRAAEAVVRVRRGEVDVLKDLGVLTKDQTDALNSMTNETDRTRTAIVELHKAFGGDAIGTQGVQSALDETIVKLGETEEALGRIASTLLESGTGVVSAVGEFLGLLDEGQNPLDAFNDRLNQLAKNFEDKGLLSGIAHVGVGIAGMVNPLAAVAGMVILSSPDEPEGGAPAAGAAAPRGDRPDNFFGTWTVDEVPEPQEPEAKKGKAVKPSRPDPNRGSDALTGADAPTEAETWQAIWEQAYYDDAKAKREAYQEKKAADIEYAKHEQDVAERRATALARTEADIAAEVKRVEDEKKAARESAAAAGFAAAEGAAGLATMFIQDEGAKAVIEGGMQVAYAIAAAASGNVPGAIGHGAAAAQFFAVAAQTGMGGGGQQKAAPVASRALPASTREQADLLGETGPSTAAPAPITVNYHSVWPPTPQQVKETRRLLNADGRRDV